MSARNAQAKPMSVLGSFLSFAPLILAVFVMMGVIQWMGQHTGLDSATALQQAEQSLDQYCAARQGSGDCNAHLLEATPMSSQRLASANTWEFRFRTQQARTVTVQVDAQGVTRLKPESYTGEKPIIKRLRPTHFLQD